MAQDSAEAIVREKYADADLQHHEASYEYGQQAPTQPESWAVYPSSGLGVQPLGVGPTAGAAWVAASTKVLEVLRKPIGLRIKQEHLADIGRPGAGEVPLEFIEAALNRGEDVTVVAPDGSMSPLARVEGGGYITKPK